MQRTIKVEPYNPDWPKSFILEAEEITTIISEELVSIFHIGSTAIPGLSAKPIIDVLVEVRDIEKVDGFNEVFIQRGYLPRGEFGISGRRFIIKGDEVNRTHHIHFFEVGNPRIMEHLNFRDYLITHPEEAKVYGRLKEALAKRYPHDIEEYMARKNELIQALNGKAKAWKESLVSDNRNS